MLAVLAAFLVAKLSGFAGKDATTDQNAPCTMGEGLITATVTRWETVYRAATEYVATAEHTADIGYTTTTGYAYGPATEDPAAAEPTGTAGGEQSTYLVPLARA